MWAFVCAHVTLAVAAELLSSAEISTLHSVHLLAHCWHATNTNIAEAKNSESTQQPHQNCVIVVTSTNVHSYRIYWASDNVPIYYCWWNISCVWCCVCFRINLISFELHQICLLCRLHVKQLASALNGLEVSASHVNFQQKNTTVIAKLVSVVISPRPSHGLQPIA